MRFFTRATELLDAAERDDLGEVLRLLESGVKPDTRGAGGLTALHLAAAHGCLLIVERLLAAGADPNARGKRHETPMHKAAGGGTKVRRMLTIAPGPHGIQATESTMDVEIVKRLAAAGADVDARDASGYTPLLIALQDGEEACAEALLDLGASPTHANARGYAPLHLAALYGRAGVVRRLLDLGADPNVQSTAGFTPLDGAREGGHPGIGDVLRAGGAWRTKDSAGGADDWIRKGDAAAGAGQIEEAVACFDRALTLHPASVRACIHKGDALSHHAELERAVESYDQAIAIDPVYSGGMAWGNKGCTLQDLGRLDEAVACYQEVLKINPRDARAWTNIGTVRNRQGRRAEAIKAYNAALKIDPTYERARAYLETFSDGSKPAAG